MNRKTMIILGSCLLLGIGVVLALYAVSYSIVHQPNNFLRTYQRYTAVKANELDINVDSYYIAGITEDHIYLGNIVAPLHMLVVNHALTDTQHVRLKIKSAERQKIYNKTTIKIDLPFFYVADGTMPGIYRGKVGEWVAERFMYDSAYFTRLVPINSSSFAIRTNTPESFDNILGKIKSDTPHVQLQPKLLEKQVDGIFCTDGSLLYNKELKKLIYTYNYRNGYIVYDTSLRLDYRGHTIDTFTRAQIKVGYVKSNDTRTLIYKKDINLGSSTSGSYLFINSNLVAKNDPANILKSMSVIDVYDLQNDKYEFSFVIHSYNDNIKMRDFMVFRNNLFIALFDHYLVKYELNSKSLLPDIHAQISEK